MEEDKKYIVKCATSKCCICGKRIKNIYKYKGKDYGYICFLKEVMKIPMDHKDYKQKPVPGYLYQLINKYINENINKIKEDVQNNNNYYDQQKVNDFEVNFWNSLGDELDINYKGYQGYIYQNSIKINGKRVPIYQQLIIAKYLQMRYKTIYNKIRKE